MRGFSGHRWIIPVALLAAGLLPSGQSRREVQRVTNAAQPAVQNQLSRATSPYLRQHADNPVHWQEWGPEALDQARREDKPIFLSIGYSACHWCHVMAHESFADPAVAAVLNAHFVNIKVDREERPDLDEIYMQATLALNDGQGGWPMSVWLTPERKPFFAGTYFPPAARWGRPGFKELCERIAAVWHEHRADIAAQADKLAAVVRDNLRAAPPGEPVALGPLVSQTALRLARSFDPDNGGLTGGGSNKFPPSMALDLLLRTAARLPGDDAQHRELLGLVELTLERMAEGGIYDQLAGGIHRYSTDVEWHVPHFEKMLYDQALVSRIYLDAWQYTRRPLYARIAREILDYVLSDLQAPAGGFFSSRDADSAGHEGRYYVWTCDELIAVLGAEDGRLAGCYFDITELGSWNDPHEPGVAKSIPRVLRCTKTAARLHKIELPELEQRLAKARAKLLAARGTRAAPALDDKILCEWNGLMISSFARGGAALGEPRFIAAAERGAEYLWEHQYVNGRLRRSSRDGAVQAEAFSSDYAALTEGLLDLHEATFEPRWLDRAVQLTDTLVTHYWDEDHGGFFFTAHDHEDLLARSKDTHDGAVPSGNSLALMNLLRLAALTADARWHDLAERQMAAFAAEVVRAPWAAERFLAAVDFAQQSPIEITIVGDAQAPATQALLEAVYATYLPNRVLSLREPKSGKDSRHAAAVTQPTTRSYRQLDALPTAYVCHAGTCYPPVPSPAALRKLLHAAP